MALPANVASLEHPSPSLLDIGGQIARDDLCLADDGDLDAEVLEGDAFDLGFDLVRCLASYCVVQCTHTRLHVRTCMGQTLAWSWVWKEPLS